MKKCVLENKICNDCGLCDKLCQLDHSKVCNNCFRCLGLEDFEEQSYAQIPISAVYLSDDFMMHPQKSEKRVHYSTLTDCRGQYKKTY